MGAEEDDPAVAAPSRDNVRRTGGGGLVDEELVSRAAEELLRSGEIRGLPPDHGQPFAAGEERPVVVGDAEG